MEAFITTSWSSVSLPDSIRATTSVVRVIRQVGEIWDQVPQIWVIKPETPNWMFTCDEEKQTYNELFNIYC